jgi:exopolysaccharide biosynthesis polyprenyl glycosylphosphotransferase
LRFDDPDLAYEIKNCDAVLINDLPAHEEHMILKQCFDLDKRVYVLPKISDILIKSSDDLNIMDTPLYLCRNMGISKVEGAIKRFFDVLISGLALLILSPVLLVVAIAIKLEDHGPVFFRQERVTLNNRHFTILKFRSMIVDAEKDGRPHPAGERDPRITKVGCFIRETRIDELPQLINSLKGDMSIVGPRPERYEHVEMYTKDIPEFSFRSKVRGGLTGYAQVYGKYNTSALDKLKLDLMYITNFSILLDLQIILETLKIIFIKESTEGFSEGKIQEIQRTAVNEKNLN